MIYLVLCSVFLIVLLTAIKIVRRPKDLHMAVKAQLSRLQKLSPAASRAVLSEEEFDRIEDLLAIHRLSTSDLFVLWRNSRRTTRAVEVLRSCLPKEDRFARFIVKLHAQQVDQHGVLVWALLYALMEKLGDQIRQSDDYYTLKAAHAYSDELLVVKEIVSMIDDRYDDLLESQF